MLLKNWDQAPNLLVCTTEEMDCNLGRTFVNLTRFEGIYQSPGAKTATEPQITTQPHLSCSFNSLFTKQCTVATIHSEPVVNPSNTGLRALCGRIILYVLPTSLSGRIVNAFEVIINLKPPCTG